jgi:large subunit ribosomal protein L14
MRTVLDNTGVREVRCVEVKRVKKAQGSVGCERIGTVQKVRPGCTFARGDRVRGIVVAVASPEVRADGSWMRRRSGPKRVLVNKKGETLGTRVPAWVSASLRTKGQAQVRSMSKGAF